MAWRGRTEPISLLVIIIGFIGRPLAEAVRDRYVDDLVRQLPDVAGPLTDRVRQLVAGTAGGDIEARRQLETELVANRRAAVALADAVQAQTGEAIPSVETSPVASHRTRDARMILLDGYQRAFYNLTLTAVFAGRPVVVDAALQGSDWLTACIPRFGERFQTIRRESFPDPEDLWDSYTLEDVERGFGQYDRDWPVRYYVRRVPNPEERERELAEREEQFQFEPDSELPRSDRRAPPEQRWLRIQRVHPRWVQPETSVLDFIYTEGEQRRRVADHEFLSFSEYPEEWKPLLKIPKPDEGIGLLMDAADRLMAREEQVRVAVQGLLDRSPFKDGTT